MSVSKYIIFNKNKPVNLTTTKIRIDTKSVKYYFGFDSKMIFLASRFMFGHKFSM